MTPRLTRGRLLLALLVLLELALVSALVAERSPAQTAPHAAVAHATTPPPAPAPLRGFTTHVVATHYLGGRSYRAEHYFKPVRPGVLQGIVFRRTTPGAPVIELEWAISAERYRALPAAQRRRWHPLAPAVDRGRVELPGLSDEAERKELAGIRGLYAQTLNVAGLDGALPTGPRGVRSVTHLAPGEHHQR